MALLSLWPHLVAAELWQYDKWYTAERVQVILARHDWLTLYGNGLPVFKKPPLQYWLSAGLQIAGLPETLALRLPSLGAALGTLCLTAHLARKFSHDAAPHAEATDWIRHLRWTTWIATDGALLWAGLITASLALPAVLKAVHKAVLRSASRHTASQRIASPRCLGDTRTAALLVGCFFAALTAANGEVFDGYLLQILPLAAAATGAALALVPRTNGLIAVAILSLSAGGPWKSAADAGLTRQGIAPYRPILASFRAALGRSDQPIVCGWEKSDQILFPGALWLLGSGGRTFRRVWSPDDLSSALASGTLVPPLRGLCLESEYRTLQARLPTRKVAANAGWVHWTLP